jgi:vanillate O-demethylase monooxygenase subunit
MEGQAMEWIRDAWYAVARADEITTTPLARTLFGAAMVLFHDSAGAAVLLRDVCPHKSAPLSLGEVTGDRIQCPYHGLQFDRGGKCVHIPGQEQIPAALRVPSWPCAESLGLIWAWPGDPARITTAPPGLARHGTPGWTCLVGTPLIFPAAIERVLDNLVDPAHTSFVHRRTIGGSDAADIPLQVSESADQIIVHRWIEGADPVPVMQRYAQFEGKVDRWQVYELHLPNLSVVDFGAVPAGASRDEASRDRYYRTYSLAALTPRDAHSTHYFWLVLRNFADGDAAVSAEMEAAYLSTFAEDMELLDRIEKVRGCSDAPPETLLGIDGGTVRLRRALAARRAAENQR